ncbi:ZP domain-containing protein, partial [Trichostrongylus colubriformis]
VHLGPASRGRIGRCWASDGKSELELSDSDGCSVQRAGEVWGDFEVSRDERGTTFLNHIKAWAFPTSNEVNIFCNLHVCAECEQILCRTRPRRVPAAGDAAQSPDNDSSPPIPVHASFRLRRLANSTSSAPPPKKELTDTSLTSMSFRHNIIVIICFMLTLRL